MNKTKKTMEQRSNDYARHSMRVLQTACGFHVAYSKWLQCGPILVTAQSFVITVLVEILQCFQAKQCELLAFIPLLMHS